MLPVLYIWLRLKRLLKTGAFGRRVLVLTVLPLWIFDIQSCAGAALKDSSTSNYVIAVLAFTSDSGDCLSECVLLSVRQTSPFRHHIVPISTNKRQYVTSPATS